MCYLSQKRFSNVFHLHKDHGGDLLRVKGLGLTFVLHLDFRSRIIADDRKRPVFHVGLNYAVIKAAANETLGI